MKRTITALAGVLAGALLLSGCGNSSAPSGDTSAGEPTSGGSLVFARESDNTSFDPTVTNDAESFWTNQQIFQTLVRASDDGMSIEPELAESWEVAGDGTSVTFTLRDDVSFSNGDPLTVEDVVFSLNRAFSAPNAWQNRPLQDAVSEAEGQVTVRSAAPFAETLNVLSSFVNSIIPADFNGQSEEEFFTTPVGTGPFMLDTWTRGQEMTLVRNPHYWEAGKPYLDSVIFSVVSDPNQRVAQLQSGAADIVRFPPLSMLDQLSEQSGIQAEAFPSTRVDMLIMNQAVEEYQDVHVRRAISLAMDRASMLNAVNFGHGAEARSYLASSQAGFDNALPELEFSLEQAKQEMAQSAYPDGFTTEYLTFAGESYGEIVQAALEPLGIEVTLRTVDINQFVGLQVAGDYEISFEYWTDSIPGAWSRSTGMLDGTSFGSYFTGWVSSEAQELIAQAAATDDANARQAAYTALQELQREEVPQVLLLETPFQYAFGSQVQGFAVNPLGSYRLQDAWIVE